MQNSKQKKEYDLAMKNRAMTGFMLRVVVAGYIVYLAWKILTGMQSGTSPIPEWAVWLICSVMAAAALGFCVYSWITYQKAIKAAEINPVPEPEIGGTQVDAQDDKNDSDQEI